MLLSGDSTTVGNRPTSVHKPAPAPHYPPSFGGQSLSIDALKALHGDGIGDIAIWYPPTPGHPSGGGPSRGGRSGGGNRGRSPDFRPIPSPPPPPPLGFTAPINVRPTGQSVPAGDIVTRQPGTRTPDSGPGDAPVNKTLIGVANPNVGASPFQAGDVPGGPDGPRPLLPAQGQLADSVCSGGYLQDGDDGLSRTSLVCESADAGPGSGSPDDNGAQSGDYGPARFTVDSDGNAIDHVGNLPNTITIGRYPAYIRDGQGSGSRVFDVGDHPFTAMVGRLDSFGGLQDDSEFWIRNSRFLDKAIANGSTVRLASDPFARANLRSGFRREVDYLISKGYSVSPDGSTMLPPQ
jgi:hypothetical protein